MSYLRHKQSKCFPHFICYFILYFFYMLFHLILFSHVISSSTFLHVISYYTFLPTTWHISDNCLMKNKTWSTSIVIWMVFTIKHNTKEKIFQTNLNNINSLVVKIKAVVVLLCEYITCLDWLTVPNGYLNAKSYENIWFSF